MLNKYETGQIIRVDMGQDVSSNTSLQFIMQPKTGTPKNNSSNEDYPNSIVRTSSDGVVVGSSDIEVGDETYLANQYLEYTTLTDDLSQSGLWRVKGTATLSPTNTISGDYKLITVLE